MKDSATKASAVAREASSLGYFGSGLALALSWKLNGSILWAIFHLLCSWMYVAWYLVIHTTLITRLLA